MVLMVEKQTKEETLVSNSEDEMIVVEPIAIAY